MALGYASQEAGGNVDGLVEFFSVDQGVAAGLLARFCKRTIRHSTIC